MNRVFIRQSYNHEQSSSAAVSRIENFKANLSKTNS